MHIWQAQGLRDATDPYLVQHIMYVLCMLQHIMYVLCMVQHIMYVLCMVQHIMYVLCMLQKCINDRVQTSSALQQMLPRSCMCRSPTVCYVARQIHVSKWMKRLEQVFFGGCEAYDAALQQPEAQRTAALVGALLRNVYEEDEAQRPWAVLLARYLIR
jgi:hypothetical protein